ncbi:chorismate mutase family protein [Gordonia paraffinivorans]|uniref:chorismate mutase family protein n=1 Tax=Gordonia paraffinivorans TaxID=175628 RepID=UPI0035E3E9BD
MNGSMHNHGPGSGEIDLAKRDLDALRAQLDRIDDRLLEDVRARIEVCMSIAHLKRRYSIPVMQPQRVGVVHEHAHRFALDHDLSPDFLHELYDLLIAETCRVEDRIVDSAQMTPDGDTDSTVG